MTWRAASRLRVSSDERISSAKTRGSRRKGGGGGGAGDDFTYIKRRQVGVVDDFECIHDIKWMV